MWNLVRQWYGHKMTKKKKKEKWIGVKERDLKTNNFKIIQDRDDKKCI